MVKYVDKKGNISDKEHKGLVEILEEQRPDLANKLGQLVAWKGNMKSYRDFLYTIPREEEMEIHPEKRDIWNKYINAVGEQNGLDQAMDFIMSERVGKKDLTDDKVLLVRSDRPFVDTLVGKADNVGTYEGWVGEIKSHFITNMKGSDLFSIDGKINARIELVNARRLSDEELGEWAVSKIMYAQHHHDTEGVFSCFNKFKAMELGEEKVLVYDKFPNVDMVVLDHILSEEEKVVADIPYSKASNIDLLPFYGNRQVSWSAFSTICIFNEKSQHSVDFLMGNDKRSVGEIYNIVNSIFVDNSDKFFSDFEIGEVTIGVFKKLKHDVSKEKIEHAKSTDEEVRWLYKHFIDSEPNFSDYTAISVMFLKDGRYQNDVKKVFNDLLLESGKINDYSIVTESSCSQGSWSSGDNILLLDAYYDLGEGMSFFGGESKRYTKNSLENEIENKKEEIKRREERVKMYQKT